MRSAATAILALTMSVPAAAQPLIEWVAPGPDQWHNPLAWSPSMVPQTDMRANFPTGGQCLVNANGGCGELFLTFGTFIDVNPGATLTVHAGLLNNAAGRITMHGSDTQSGVLSFADPATIIDDVGVHPFGQIELMAFDESTLFSAQVNNGTSGVLTFEGAMEVHGTGLVQADLINNSTRGFFANLSGRTLDLGGRPKVNNGLFQALNGGILRLRSTIDQGPGGVIEADGGVVLLDGVTIVGGTVRTVGGPAPEAGGAGGVIRVGTGGTLESVDLEGDIAIPGGSSLTIRLPGITSDGVILVNEKASATRATLVASSSSAPGAAVLDGSGTVVLNAESEGNLQSAAVVIASGNELDLGADHTLRGTGRIEGTGLLTNRAIVLADVPGRSLILQSDVANEGLIRAAPGAKIQIDSGQPWTQAPAAAVEIEDAMLIYTRGTIAGGAVRALGTGRIEIGVATGNAIFQDLSLDAPMDIPNGETAVFRGTVVNDGVVTVNSDAGPTATFLDMGTDADTVNGKGAIVLNAPDLASITLARISVGSFDTFTQGPGHTVAGTGQLSGQNSTFINGGTAAPGAPGSPQKGAGRIDMNSVGYTQTASGRLEIQIGGLIQCEQYDALTTNRAVSLAGTLAVSLINGFTPQKGDSFTIIQGASVTGTLTLEPPGAPFDVVYEANQVRLVATEPPPACPGDLDGDNDVDTTDLNILLSDFGCTAGPGNCPGDLDNDGDTDTTDLNILLSGFGCSP